MVRAALDHEAAASTRARAPARTIVPAAIGHRRIAAVGACRSSPTSGWYPDFGFLVLIAWRLLRADAWPAWWAAPLGFVNDL